MGLFLDSGNIEIVKQYHAMGIIRGVTTNPTLLVKEGLAKNMRDVRKRIIEIAEWIAPFPVSVEVTSNKQGPMLKQSLEFSGWAENINVKVPIHGPQGELENLKFIHELETKRNIRVNVTAMMSAQQCFLAAMAGASYVSIFCGRVNDMGYDASNELRRLRGLLTQFNLPAQIIAASSREALNVLQWFEAGAHIVTVLPALVPKMLIHPYTKETVAQFIHDGAKLQKQ